MPVTIEEFKLKRTDSLLGFARLRLGNGMTFLDVPMCNSNGTFWASPASKPAITRDGTYLKGKGGKLVYKPVVMFASKELREGLEACRADVTPIDHRMSRTTPARAG